MSNKRLSGQKKIKRRQNQSLQKLYAKIRNSTDLSDVLDGLGDTSRVTINDTIDEKYKIHDIIDGDSVLFVEDRTGDDSIHATVVKDLANCCGDRRSVKRKPKKNGSPLSRPSKRKTDTITLSDEEDAQKPSCDPPIYFPSKTSTPPRRNLMVCPVHSSTPIQNKSHQLNVSNLSNIPKVSPTNVNAGEKLTSDINDLMREIDANDYVTIDLTSGTRDSSVSESVVDLTRRKNSVIDLDKEDGECSLSAVSSASLADSEVTVVNVEDWNKKKEKMNENQIAAGIAKMNSSEKGRLLELITEKIFNGCKVPSSKRITKARNSVEDSYIKDMIEGDIRNSIGDNVYNPLRTPVQRTGLRMIVIDGSNVAMNHGMKQIFSVKGLKICIDYFLKRGHTVKAFVPQYRCISGKSSDPQLLSYLEKRGLVVYTPSRRLNEGRCIASYDDRFIVQCAAEFDAVIVSQDRYRDLAVENPGWRRTIDTRLLQYTWVNDMLMFPLDPLGKDGPRLDVFLRHAD